MTTIVTVHRTFSSHGNDSGDKRWQKSSDFQNCVDELIETEDSELDSLAVYWSGENSEKERRCAGKDLYKLLR